ncbi:MAG: hypothetical protein EBQ94_02220 [Flavobacteriales bacterium]|nr:hypothetical protein [Crocinitomicaceae bacterium]NBX79186.1 hypothetical protein [Flavobacteriales bacterium]NCA19765.1 hypothetical protein [Crocinitomicaceae bacterium]
MDTLRENKINYINIGLMLLSIMAAFIMPFETFLFAYAFLGPLHYLTEISWLHDRNYFSKGKYDFVFLLVVGLVITYDYFASKYGFHQSFTTMYSDLNLYGKMLSLALFGSILFALVENIWVKIVAILLLFAFVDRWFAPNFTTQNGEVIFKNSTATFTVTSLVPTLIHVYIFTGLFMLYGSLKSRNVSGLISVVVFALAPVILWNFLQDTTVVPITQYGRDAYYAGGDGFWDLNVSLMKEFDLTKLPTMTDSLGRDLYYVTGEKAIDSKASLPIIFESGIGIMLMRIIAFAYLYHYLNWFSKTEVIRWHAIPKTRFIAVIVLWLTACGLYAYDYSMGLTYLFFLSFCHVLLEFPLNVVSIVGIGKESYSIFTQGFRKTSVK